MRIAVALADLERIDESVRASMLAGRLDVEHPIAHVGEPRQESIQALEFCCDVVDAAMIIDILRSWDSESKQHPTRAYFSRDEVGAAWCKIPGNVQLSLSLTNGEVILNSAAFADTTITFQSSAPVSAVAVPANAAESVRVTPVKPPSRSLLRIVG